MNRTVSGLAVASICLQTGGMPAWERLAQHVVARRLELGHKQRQGLADAAAVSLRTLGDIEKARRTSYDPNTIAALENALGWEPGTVNRVVAGHEPRLRRPPTGSTRDILGFDTEEDAALIRVMQSNLPDALKRQIAQVLIDERESADKRRLAQAEQMIRLVGGDA